MSMHEAVVYGIWTQDSMITGVGLRCQCGETLVETIDDTDIHYLAQAWANHQRALLGGIDLLKWSRQQEPEGLAHAIVDFQIDIAELRDENAGLHAEVERLRMLVQFLGRIPEAEPYETGEPCPDCGWGGLTHVFDHKYYHGVRHG